VSKPSGNGRSRKRRVERRWFSKAARGKSETGMARSDAASNFSHGRSGIQIDIKVGVNIAHSAGKTFFYAKTLHNRQH